MWARRADQRGGSVTSGLLYPFLNNLSPATERFVFYVTIIFIFALAVFLWICVLMGLGHRTTAGPEDKHPACYS